MIMHPGVFGPGTNPGTFPGLGRWVYLADAKFNPHGETHLHPHREIDVISLMVEGRIRHEGSLQHGQELGPYDVQVQRAGGEGFSHNEVNPDSVSNRMIQFWVVPETPGEPASYRLYHVNKGDVMRVYGGHVEQSETFPARTEITIARLNPGETVAFNGETLAYVVSGTGRFSAVSVAEGHLVYAISPGFEAGENSLVIVGTISETE